MSKQRMNCVSLFTGGGGLTLGLEMAGFRTLLATDADEQARQTFALNKPGVPFLRSDIRRVQRPELAELLKVEHVHLVAGGPPCQGFTTLGDQLAADPRNDLFAAFVRVVQWTNADAFLMENVAYLRSQYHGRYEREITATFESLG